MVIISSNYIISVHLDNQDSGQQQDLSDQLAPEFLKYDPLDEVMANPSRYIDRPLRIKAELTNYTGENRISDWAIKSEAGKLQLKSCNLEKARENRIDILVTIGSYRTCSCIYKDPTFGWDDNTLRQTKISACINSTPPLYVDSRCNSDRQTHYYFECNATFTP